MTDFAQVSVSPDQFTVIPAGQAEASIHIQNSSTVVDVFTIEVLGLDDSWVAFSVNSVSLFPGDSGTSDLTLRVPRDSSAKAGTYPFTVKVASRKDRSISVDIECTLEVEPYYDVSAELHPQQLTGPSGQFTATLTNSGNTEMQVGLNGTDPQAALSYSYSRQTPRLAPGESQQVTITVTARRQPLRGLPRSYPFQIKASGPLNTMPPLELHGALTVPPRLPRWAIPAAIAAVVGLVVIIALIIALGGRDSDSPSTGAESQAVTPIVVAAGSPLAGAMELSPQQQRTFEVIVEEPGLLILQVQWDVTGNGLRITIAASESDQGFIQALQTAGLPTTLLDEELLIESGEFRIRISRDYVSQSLTVSFENRTVSDTNSSFSLSFRPDTGVIPGPASTATAAAATQTPTPTPTPTAAATATATPTSSPTATATSTASPTATVTPTPTVRHTLKIDPVPLALGNVLISPPSEPDGQYADGTPIKIQAEPARGCVFISWSGSMTSGDQTLSFRISSDIILKAAFRCLTPIVTPTPTPGIIILPPFDAPKLDLTPLILLP